MKMYFFMFVGGAIAFGVFASVLLSAMDMPTVAKSMETRECVYVLTTDGKHPCSYINLGKDRYRIHWVM